MCYPSLNLTLCCSRRKSTPGIRSGPTGNPGKPGQSWSPPGLSALSCRAKSIAWPGGRSLPAGRDAGSRSSLRSSRIRVSVRLAVQRLTSLLTTGPSSEALSISTITSLKCNNTCLWKFPLPGFRRHSQPPLGPPRRGRPPFTETVARTR